MGQNDITWGQANSTGMTPDQISKKAEQRTCLSTNIDKWFLKFNFELGQRLYFLVMCDPSMNKLWAT